MKIPFVDLRAQHEELRPEIEALFANVIDNSTFIGGLLVESFEKDFAAYCESRYAVACASGTDALKLALMAAGIRAEDEVITTPLTFIATVEAISLIGAIPALVDIDPATCNISPAKLAAFFMEQCRLGSDGKMINAKTGRRVTAILPVHLYGLPADMAVILRLADQYDLPVIEDACQAHGATVDLNGKSMKAGSMGTVSAFSFYPGKNLGAMGEGGAAVTNNKRDNEIMRIWRDHGQSERYVHLSPDGWNGRLDSLQCGILSLKLRKLDEWNERRRRAADWYKERLSDDERIGLPVEPAGRKHVYHLFEVRLNNRNRVAEKLQSSGVATGYHYPIPLHLQKAYADLGWKNGDFPEAESAARSLLSLPMFPHITEDQVDCVCRQLKIALS